MTNLKRLYSRGINTRELVEYIMERAVFKFAPKLTKQLTLTEYISSVLPKELETKDMSSYLQADLVGHDGIDMHLTEQLERLERWKNLYGSIFKCLRDDPEINTRCLGENYLHNGQYPTPDAEIYAAMILDYRPLNIIEIGTGFSTLIARKTINESNIDCKIIAIDPKPRRDINGYTDSILYNYIEDIEISKIPINEKSLIFIDSSHVTRSRGDVPHLYGRILPNLPPGTLVHVHDIFIPYDYPFIYQKMLYTEQYVLQALLTHSNKYKVVFATHYMTRQHLDAMQETFSDIIGKDDLYCGSSLWLEAE